MKLFQIIPALLLAPFFLPTAYCDERTHTPEQMEKLAKDGQLDAEDSIRPAGLLNFIKGDLPPTGKASHTLWTLGPTGVIGVFNHKSTSDQFLVQGTLKGSPAEGKFLSGDVIIGLNGTKFKSMNLGILIGNAIVEAEKPANRGKISFEVWRDKNFIARNGKQDMTNVDIDKFFNEASDDNSLYDWKADEERAEEVKQMGFGKFPVDPTEFTAELTIRTFPEYADTAPYDCPKTKQILEEAWKVLEQKFIENPKIPRSGRGGAVEAIALIASGKPEHREIVKNWVRGKYSPWKPPVEPAGAMFERGKSAGSQSWQHGYTGLYCAIYYEATGDDYVLPALQKFAINTALGQSAQGTWGHTFAFPSFNGGEFHQMNPGYGALNAAGNRCYFLITLAQKLGIEHPEIDRAVKRSTQFFSSYIDQGCIPYGDHAAYASDDSNGKNTGVAFSLKLLGDDYGAKYFAMLSSNCAFTRRGGHAHDYHGNWSSWAAGLCGPEVRSYNERNLRWRRTLCRMYDGSFVYASPTGPYKTLRDPTATEVLHQAVALKQTIITGKEIGEPLDVSERDIKQLLASASWGLNDPWLIAKAGKSMTGRSTDELFDLLDHFFPKFRATVAKELAERSQKGEEGIQARLVELLGSDNARFREGALLALGASGSDTVLSNLSKVTTLLNDPKDFVRISAAKVISKATETEDTQLAMLKATVDKPDAVAPNAVRNTTQDTLFGKDTPLANDPFNAGFDKDLVEEALEGVILLDPAGKTFMAGRKDKWSKDTVIRIAGPLTYAAEEEQVGDQMFANRSAPAQALLGKYGYGEAILATAHRLRKMAAIRRDIRPFVDYKDTLMDPDLIEQDPAAFFGLIDEMETVLIANPIQQIQRLVNDKPVDVPLEPFYSKIKAQKKATVMPSVADDAKKQFFAELDAEDGMGAKLKLCRKTLSDPTRKDFFRKIAAMEFLEEIMGPDAMEDLLPYLGHDDWRLKKQSREIASRLIATGAGELLLSQFAKVSEASTKAAILELLADTGEKDSISTVKEALKNDAPIVRQTAVGALAKLAGEEAIPDILAHLKTASAKGEMIACEEALLSSKSSPKAIEKIRKDIVAMLPDTGSETRSSIYFILSMIGDNESISVLRAALDTDDFKEFDEIIFALSYSPSREADKVLLDMAALDSRTAKIVGSYSLRRMVLGPEGYGDVTTDEKMDFAEAMLKMALDRKLIQYLGQVYEARALRALMYCLEKGVESAADSLVACAEGMENLSAKDAKIAAQSLQDVIEYIEVTRLRGGIKAHMDVDDRYLQWKALQARAGKVLLKVHKPEEVPIPEFDPLELDR